MSHLRNVVDSRWSVLDEKLSLSISDPDWRRIQLDQRIRIRIEKPDPDPGSSKLAPQKGKNEEISCIRV
jgi:hypothetical protein